ncbi:MAG: hypothetical protein GXY09_12235 [Bacteroidales bacterium]|nr:hypothetical protein [Bacteroidales bacterium]
MKRIESKQAWLAVMVLGALLALMLFQIVFKVNVVYKGMAFPFGDLVGISSASECVRVGLNPYLENSIDPFGREFNYPAIWLSLADLVNFDGKDVMLVGWILIILFSLSIAFLFKVKRFKQGLFYLAFILSPPVLLLLERGNSDIILFLLVALMTVYLPRLCGIPPLMNTYIAAGIIVLATFLKLYPLVLLPLLILEPVSLRHRMTVLLVSGILVAGYLIDSFDIITLITQNTPQPLIMAYGKNVLMEKFFSDGTIPLVSNALILVAVIGVIVMSLKGKRFIHTLFPTEQPFQEAILPYMAGALIFAGTFVLGNNYIYRLVFLLLTLPYLLNQLAYFTAGQKASRFSSENALLVSSLLLMGIYGTGVFDFFSDETWRIVDWCMVGLLLVLLLLSLYPYFKKENSKWSVQWLPCITILQFWMVLLQFYGYRMGEFFISWYAVMGLASWGLLLTFFVAVIHFLTHQRGTSPARH